ncbi:MAG: methyltransferase domain-containing protein [Nitrospirota bacterium]|nr:methyltransferase domain-containing protein [Nitrospirota bacterium]
MGRAPGSTEARAGKEGSPEPNPFDDPAVAARYERWYAGEGAEADVRERQLLGRLLADFPQAESVLEVGCGTGHFTRWMGNHDFRATGLDPSWAMLAETARRDHGPYVQGDGHGLPFHDQTFDLVMLITTLEFVANPIRVLTEATRVARQGLLIGALNRNSLLARRYVRSGNPLWKSAHFFSVNELTDMTVKAAGRRLGAVAWKTTLWPLRSLPALPLPWGGFIGLAARLHGPT